MLLVKANFSLFSYSVFLVLEIKTLKLKLSYSGLKCWNCFSRLSPIFASEPERTQKIGNITTVGILSEQWKGEIRLLFFPVDYVTHPSRPMRQPDRSKGVNHLQGNYIAIAITWSLAVQCSALEVVIIQGLKPISFYKSSHTHAPVTKGWECNYFSLQTFLYTKNDITKFLVLVIYKIFTMTWAFFKL